MIEDTDDASSTSGAMVWYSSPSRRFSILGDDNQELYLPLIHSNYNRHHYHTSSSYNSNNNLSGDYHFNNNQVHICGTSSQARLLSRLSADEWTCIILYCNRQDNINLSETCRSLYILCSHDLVWKHLLQTREEKALLYKLKTDYQHLFPPYEFPEVRFVDFDNIYDHKRRFIELRKEVDLRLNKRLEYQSMEYTLNSSSLLKRRCYQCTVSTLWVFLLLFLVAMSVTCALFALYLDNILPHSHKTKTEDVSYSWVIVYSPLGFVIAPFCFFLSFLICVCMGWVPTLSEVLQRLYTKTDRSPKGKLDSVFERFLLAKNRGAGQKQQALMRLARILPMQLLWFPMLLIMIGIKEFFFAKQKLWSYFFIPVHVCMLISAIDLPFQLYWLNKVKSIRSSHFIALLIATANIFLIYFLFAGSIAFIAVKMDNLLPVTIKWSLTFIPLYVLMLLVWINAGLGFLYLASLSDIGTLTIHDCMSVRNCRLMTTMVLGPMFIMALIIEPVALSTILLGQRLDGSKMKFMWVFAPMIIGFSVNAFLLVIVSITVKLLPCILRRRRSTTA